MPIRPHSSSRQSPLAPTPLHLLAIFTRIGLTSFGGGLSGWLLREFVNERQWLSEEEFLNGLSLSQALPGINVKNMAIWIGYRLCGKRGAIAGFSGIIIPPAILIVLFGLVFAALARFPATRFALAGAAAGAVGLSLAMALTAVRRVPRRLMSFIVMLATFASIGVLHFPTVYVVLVAAVVSITVEYRRLGDGTLLEAEQREHQE
ncbi:chromate transporter [Caballeronia sp. LZ025]|uniref:chromate transporter n=1 Tax=Caballeronia TaxID=1827195 RepID=UPI001FD5DA38|nr:MULTISPECIES: chromate transporter [Caballeronia]MDR5734017.1 chromate transporter [Caballeronia sp. LZ025]